MTAPTPSRGEVQLVAEALCTCSQSYGIHSKKCATITTGPRMAEVLAAHDRRIHRDTEPFCGSCGLSLANLDRTVVDGHAYCLTDCTRPPETP